MMADLGVFAAGMVCGILLWFLIERMVIDPLVAMSRPDHRRDR